MAQSVHLSADAYATLAALKRPGESFSDVVLRLAASRKHPAALRRLSPIPEGFDLVAFREKAVREDDPAG